MVAQVSATIKDVRGIAIQGPECRLYLVSAILSACHKIFKHHARSEFHRHQRLCHRPKEADELASRKGKGKPRTGRHLTGLGDMPKLTRRDGSDRVSF